MAYRVWLMSLIEYSDDGKQATVVKSFTKPAKDSDCKQGNYAKKPKQKPKQVFRQMQITSADEIEQDDIL